MRNPMPIFPTFTLSDAKAVREWIALRTPLPPASR
jgi:hypothetical protein